MRNFWLISPSVTINFSKMITNPSHQTDSRRAAKYVDICYTGWPHDGPFGEEISAKGIPGLVVSFAMIFFH